MCSSINKNLLKINKKVGEENRQKTRSSSQKEKYREFSNTKKVLINKQRQMQETVRCQFSTDQVGEMENSDTILCQ